ncbi:hypothetical protein RvY_02996-1 [Ramazzottius varieornatus]|uniref:Uncharacterized protein n=1 Tax=Ramazzottius varieornatus TaxID=947166 RepID=A0A1D1UWR8_RAMVA|nr:hypothetical protein RvY_02996-1 [Ramazzottius varieornatus]
MQVRVSDRLLYCGARKFQIYKTCATSTYGHISCASLSGQLRLTSTKCRRHQFWLACRCGLASSNQLAAELYPEIKRLTEVLQKKELDFAGAMQRVLGLIEYFRQNENNFDEQSLFGKAFLKSVEDGRHFSHESGGQTAETVVPCG